MAQKHVREHLISWVSPCEIARIYIVLCRIVWQRLRVSKVAKSPLLSYGTRISSVGIIIRSTEENI
jgi:hypothetical protein